MMLREFASALVAGLTLAQPVLAQRRMVPVHGVVFDSLRGKPMRNAFVSIAGSSRVISTDARGRFEFDSVPAGPLRVVAQHPVLDSIGLSGLSAHTTVTDGSAELRLAVPSFPTLWAFACGKSKAPNDSGIVYGTVRDAAHGTPVPNATVDLLWSDLVLDKKHRIKQRRWRIEVRSNESGGFAACGVAPDLGLQIHAAAGGRSSGAIDLPPLATRVQRRDLLVGEATERDSSDRGSIAGSVTGPGGLPVADARVVVDDLPEVRTSDDGSFAVHGVTPGTREVRILTIGAVPTQLAVDVSPRKTATVSVEIPKIVTLETVHTRAERNLRRFAAEFTERRRSGFGYARDSTEIARYDQFINVLRDVPGMTVQYRPANMNILVPDGVGGVCPPRVMIDGAEAGFGHLLDLFPKEVAAVEVYVRAAHIPARFVPAGIQPQCGMILVWTKYGMRNR